CALALTKRRLPLQRNVCVSNSPGSAPATHAAKPSLRIVAMPIADSQLVTLVSWLTGKPPYGNHISLSQKIGSAGPRTIPASNESLRPTSSQAAREERCHFNPSPLHAN